MPIPTNTCTYEYIRIHAIRTNTYQYMQYVPLSIRTSIRAKLIHTNTYKNTCQNTYPYIPIHVHWFNTCQYVHCTSLMEVTGSDSNGDDQEEEESEEAQGQSLLLWVVVPSCTYFNAVIMLSLSAFKTDELAMKMHLYIRYTLYLHESVGLRNLDVLNNTKIGLVYLPKLLCLFHLISVISRLDASSSSQEDRRLEPEAFAARPANQGVHQTASFVHIIDYVILTKRKQ